MLVDTQNKIFILVQCLLKVLGDYPIAELGVIFL